MKTTLIQKLVFAIFVMALEKALVRTSPSATIGARSILPKISKRN